MSARLTLFFEPLDVLQFRDHRPFDAGEQFLARSIFPRPSVFLGCIRTALFRELGADFHSSDEYFGITAPWARDLLGDRDSPGSLTLRGPLLARRSGKGPPEALFLPPQDLVCVGKEQGVPTNYRVLQASQLDVNGPARFHWNGGALQRSSGALPWVELDMEKDPDPFFLTRQGAECYRKASPDVTLVRRRRKITDWGESAAAEHELDTVDAAELYKPEERVGIQRDANQLTAQDQMFYMTKPFRLAEGVGFAVDVAVPVQTDAQAAVLSLDGRVVPLGGKAHRARIHVLQGLSLLPPFEWNGQARDKPIKLWFLTPFVLPGDRTKHAWLDGVHLWVTDRAEPAGGYDMAKRAPKPLRRVLPAGSIAHVTKEGSGGALKELVFDRTDGDSKAGYGTVLVTAPPSAGA